MKKNIMMVIALTILLVFVGIQAYEIQNIKTTLTSGDVEITGASTASETTKTASKSTDKVKSLNELPTMVGGC